MSSCHQFISELQSSLALHVLQCLYRLTTDVNALDEIRAVILHPMFCHLTHLELLNLDNTPPPCARLSCIPLRLRTEGRRYAPSVHRVSVSQERRPIVAGRGLAPDAGRQSLRVY
jgi:hypothetical protein